MCVAPARVFKVCVVNPYKVLINYKQVTVSLIIVQTERSVAYSQERGLTWRSTNPATLHLVFLTLALYLRTD